MAVLTLVVAALASSQGPAPTVMASAPSTTQLTATTVLDNDFIPTDANLSDCISGVPRPGCGSDAKGGWRQALVFGVVVAGMVVVAWRLVRAVRGGRRVA